MFIRLISLIRMHLKYKSDNPNSLEIKKKQQIICKWRITTWKRLIIHKQWGNQNCNTTKFHGNYERNLVDSIHSNDYIKSIVKLVFFLNVWY